MPSQFGKFLSGYAKSVPNALAIIYGDKRLTWGELNDRVNSLANALLDLGIEKGDKGVIMFHNCPEFVESKLALQKIGAMPVPMNFRFVASEIEYQADHSDATTFIFEDLWLDQVNQARPNLKKIKNYICAGKKPKDMLNYESLIDKYPRSEPNVMWEITEDDPCVLLYTGGTTGLPKGAILSYSFFRKNIEATLRSIPFLLSTVKIGPVVRKVMPILGIDRLIDSSFSKRLLSGSFAQQAMGALAPYLIGSTMLARMLYMIRGILDMKFMLPSPIFHIGSYGYLEFLHIQFGITFVFPTTNVSFDSKEVCETIERERPFICFMVPTMYKKLVEYEDLHKYNTNSLLVTMVGGAPSHAELKKEIIKKFPNTIVMDIFGQTEVTPTTMKLDTEIGKVEEKSVGTPLAGCETRIVDEQGNDVKPGETGEIIYRYGMMKEYYKDPKKTAETIKDGWFYSGDLGYFDEAGEIRTVERKGESISSGGEKIYPIEVEEILAEHPKVEEVCVIGVPDPTWGEAVRAIIQLEEGKKATSEEIIDWCSGKIAGYKKPKSVLFVDFLPLTPAGKIRRGEVKKKYGEV